MIKCSIGVSSMDKSPRQETSSSISVRKAQTAVKVTIETAILKTSTPPHSLFIVYCYLLCFQLTIFTISDKKYQHVSKIYIIYFSQYLSCISTSYRNLLYQTPHHYPLGPSIYIFHRFSMNVAFQSPQCFYFQIFTLKFYLRNPAATRGVSPSFLDGAYYVV